MKLIFLTLLVSTLEVVLVDGYFSNLSELHGRKRSMRQSNDEMSKRSELPVGLINVKHFGKENGYAKKDIPMRFLSKKDIPMRFLSKKDIPMRFLSKRENEEDIPMRFLSKRGELPMRFLAKKDDEKNSEEELPMRFLQKRSQEKLCKRVVDICSNVLDQKR
ncbi:uncharacterized protein [Clytia hemisphaerica]|uniref:uncharacterized protein isoform X2 n=1 Tax=Clytia hemisphaerica TaxID=252671 RepID=UPI0034D49533